MLDTLKPPDVVQTPAFRNGDPVLVDKGPNQGAVGTFVNYRDDDPTWADITDQNSQVRSHPVEWLRQIPHGNESVR